MNLEEFPQPENNSTEQTTAIMQALLADHLYSEGTTDEKVMHLVEDGRAAEFRHIIEDKEYLIERFNEDPEGVLREIEDQIH